MTNNNEYNKRTGKPKSSPDDTQNLQENQNRPSNRLIPNMDILTTNTKTAKLNLDNLNKLQEELIRDTLITRTKTMSTISGTQSEGIMSLIKKATDKINGAKLRHQSIADSRINPIKINHSLISQSYESITSHGGGSTIEIALKPRNKNKEGTDTLITTVSTILTTEKDDLSKRKSYKENKRLKDYVGNKTQIEHDDFDDFRTVLTSNYDDRRSLIQKDILDPEIMFHKTVTKHKHQNVPAKMRGADAETTIQPLPSILVSDNPESNMKLEKSYEYPDDIGENDDDLDSNEDVDVNIADNDGIAADDGIADYGIADDYITDDGIADDGIADDGIADDGILEDICTMGCTIKMEETNGIGTIAIEESVCTEEQQTNLGKQQTNFRKLHGIQQTNPGTLQKNLRTLQKNPRKLHRKRQTNPGTLQTNPGTLQTNARKQHRKQQTNPGTFQTNPGTLQTNPGTLQTNSGTQYRTLQTNSGTLQTNPGTLQTNSGTLQTNSETQYRKQQKNPGTLQTNSGTLQTNPGTLQTNSGTLQTNPRTQQTNPGTLQTNSETQYRKQDRNVSEPGTYYNRFLDAELTLTEPIYTIKDVKKHIRSRSPNNTYNPNIKIKI